MDNHEFTRYAKILGNGRATLTHGQSNDAERLAHVLRKKSLSDFSDFLLTNKHEPVLVVYMADGWATKIRSTYKTEIDGHIISRQAQFRHEFCLQRVIVRTLDIHGNRDMRMHFFGPVALKHGRTHMHMFSLACESVGVPGAYGHMDISVNAYLFDGGMLHPLSEYLMARHQLGSPDPDDERGSFYDDSQLCLCFRCASHVASSAVSHALDTVRPNAEINKTVNITIASIRQSMWAIFGQLDNFVGKHLKFCTDRSGTDEEIHSWWAFLGVEATFTPVLVHMDLRWDGVNLCVSNRVSQTSNYHDHVRACVEYLFRLENFVETRFCGVGSSCRLYMRSRAVGVTAVIGMCKDVNVDMTFLSGHAQCTPEVLRFMAVACGSAYPSESFLRELFDDDRVLRRLDIFKASITDEIEYLMTLPKYIWQRLASLTEGSCTATTLESETINAAIVGASYIHREVLDQIECEPMSLTQGNIELKLEVIRARTDYIENRLTRQVRNLMVNHLVSIPKMVRVLTLARELPFSTNLIEQAHGISANIMKYRELLEENALCARSLVGQMKALFMRDPQTTFLVSLENKLRIVDDRLRSQQRRSAFSHFYTAFSKTACARALVSPGVGGRKSMQRASIAYKKMNEGERRVNEAQTDRGHVQDIKLVYEERETLRNQIGLYNARHSEELQREGIVNHNNSCRYDEAAVTSIREDFQSASQDGLFGLTLRSNSLPSPHAPTREEQAVLMDMAHAMFAPFPALPWFTPHICQNRELFRFVGFTNDPHAATLYMFTFAHKKPYDAWFIKLHRQPAVLHARPQRHRIYWRYSFSLLPLEHVCVTELPFCHGDDLYVFPDLKLLSGVACTQLEPLQYADFIRFHPSCKSQPNRARIKRRPAFVDEDARIVFLAAHPWLTDDDLKPGGFDEQDPRPAKRGRIGMESASSGSPAKGKKFDDDDSSVSSSEDSEADIDEALADIRKIWESETLESEHFYVRVLGGKWTAKHCGTIANACVALARSSTRVWCERFSWPKQNALYYKRYGQEASHRLTEELCRRARFLITSMLMLRVQGIKHSPLSCMSSDPIQRIQILLFG
jgi:hypothetical protein